MTVRSAEYENGCSEKPGSPLLRVWGDLRMSLLREDGFSSSPLKILFLVNMGRIAPSVW